MFLRALGANWLVCLAVWMAIASFVGDLVFVASSCWYPHLEDEPEDATRAG